MKYFFALLLFFLTASFFFVHQTARAQDENNASLTVSDAVYADLALRHNLDNVSIYYDDKKTNETIALNETRHWLPASTVKTFAAMYAYKLIRDGKLHLYDFVLVDAKNDVPTELVTDEFPTLQAGESVSIDRLIKQMITQSDNTAFNVLLDVLGRDNINTYIQSLGMIHSHVGSKLNLDTSQEQYEFDAPGYGINTTTAEDYAKAFQLIKDNKIAGSKELFTVLSQQKINNMIPLLLPKNVTCAHKTGDLDPLFHDGGICRDKNKSYVLTIFTNAGDPNLLAHLSELVYTKDVDLVGKALDKSSAKQISEDQPIDDLVLSQVPASSVLAASTQPFQMPAITAADLGITAGDLSLVIKDKDLPPVIIPADSPLHQYVNDWQILKRTLTPTAEGRLAVDLETAKLRIAESKDLLRRGKQQQAEEILSTIQPGLTQVAGNTTLKNEPSQQTQVQAISETRFAVLGDQVKATKGNAKVALIKTIAREAENTVQTVVPKIPDATNAVNPSQKPLIGEVISTSTNQVTVKTAGGQIITIPTNNAQIAVRSKVINENAAADISLSGPSLSPSVSPSSTPLGNLATGTTVALLGSSVNNTFSPTLVLTNIPRELAAPEPVTVAKVDTRHNTMVVVENGVYTQVNVNKNTIIKSSSTNIPLNAIQAGDVVVVHGEPLTQTPPTVTTTPTPANTNGQKGSQVPSVTSGTEKQGGLKLQTSPGAAADIMINQTDNTAGQSGSKTSSPNQSNTAGAAQAQTSGNSQTGNTSPKTPAAAPAPATNTGKPSTPAPQPAPRVIQSTSIQVVEKKQDTKPAPPAPAPKKEEPKKEEPKPQPLAAPPQAPAAATEEKKK